MSILIVVGILLAIAGIVWALSGPSTDAVIREILSNDSRFTGVKWEVKPIYGQDWVYLFGSVKSDNDAFDLKVVLWDGLRKRKIKPAAITDYGLNISESKRTMGQVWNTLPGGGAPRPHVGPNY